MGKATSALRSQVEALARVKRFIEKARAKCRALGWELLEVFLVGSRARGDYLVESDVDLVLVVRGVKGLNAIERLEALKDILEPGIEPRVYDVEEWKTGESAWIRELRKEAVKIE